MSPVHTWIMVLSLVTCVLATVEGRPAGSSLVKSSRFDDVQCSVDDDGRHEVLDKCLKLGSRFIRKYIKALGQGDRKFDVCQSSQKYITCIEPLVQRCPGIKHVMHNHWRNITAYLKCACHEKNTECLTSLDCLSIEYRSLLIARCNSLFNFNIRQNTRDHCHFLREAINCKDALITSQCGDATGEFAYHLFRLSNDEFVIKNRCHLPRNPTYQGFRYTDNNGQCSDFLSDMKTCVRENISRKQMLSFRGDNDLVVKERHSKKEIKEACSRYRQYESCMKPIQDRCPAGPQLIYEIDPELRSYKMKMEYICKTARKRYLPNVKCYNKIHTDGTLKQCNEHVWDDVATYLDNMTSYQIYCQPELPIVKALKQELDKVRLCYEEVVDNECNKTASYTLSEFMKIVFTDPDYLHQGFVADCELHRPSPPDGSTSVGDATASTASQSREARQKTSAPQYTTTGNTTAAAATAAAAAAAAATTTTTTNIAINKEHSLLSNHMTKQPTAPAHKLEAESERSTSGSGTILAGVLMALTGYITVAVIT